MTDIDRTQSLAYERYRSFVLAVFTICATVIAREARAEPFGSPTRVHATIAGNQNLSDLQMNGRGESLVFVRDEARGNATFVQRFDAAGRPFWTNEWSIVPGSAIFAGSAMDGAGNFVVVRIASDGAENGIFAGLYRRDGTLVRDFRVNDAIAGNQIGSSASMNARGEFVITWITDVPQRAMMAKRFRADGTPAAPEMQVSPGFEGLPGTAGVKVDPLGNFVVCYLAKAESDPFLLDIWVRLFSATGAAIGNPIRVNAFPRHVFNGAKMAMNERGDFTVVWDELMTTSGPTRVSARSFTASGSPIFSELPVTASTSIWQSAPDVALAADRSFVVSWVDGSTNTRVMARSFYANGAARSEPFTVAGQEPTSTIWPSWPRIAMAADGSYAVAWTRTDSGSQRDAWMRRYAPEGVAIRTLINAVPVNGLSGAAQSWRHFRFTVPPGATRLRVSIAAPANTGDADLYLRFGALPSLVAWDARPYVEGSNEGITATGAVTGDWYIGVQGFTAFSSVALQATYQ
jgi:serine protease